MPRTESENLSFTVLKETARIHSNGSATARYGDAVRPRPYIPFDYPVPTYKMLLAYHLITALRRLGMLTDLPQDIAKMLQESWLYKASTFSYIPV